MYKTGIGYDIHRLADGRRLFIGGIEIPYIKGLLGHSDGDVLLHAICDGLLGAACGGDIGELFPDNDPKYHNIASIELLKQTKHIIEKKGFSIVNIDAVIIAEEPKLFAFKKQIAGMISSALGLEEGLINIKAKTNEGIDGIGEKEAISAYAAVLLSKGGN